MCNFSRGKKTRKERERSTFVSWRPRNKFIRMQTIAARRTLFVSSILFWLSSLRYYVSFSSSFYSSFSSSVSLVLSCSFVRVLACIQNRRESCDDWRKSIQFRRISNSIIWTWRVGEEQAGECKCDKWVRGGIIRRNGGTKSTATSGCSAWPTQLS